MNVTGMLLTKLCWVLQIKNELKHNHLCNLNLILKEEIVTACYMVLNIEYVLMGSRYC